MPTASGYAEASKLIKRGQLVAFPTETVYGLGADATNATAVASTFVAKGRPNDNPLIVHVANAMQIDMVASRVSDMARLVIDQLMPGSITIVLPKSRIVPDIVTASLPTVAVRMPASIQARQFIDSCGVPLSAPSANTSTRPSPTTYRDVLEDMQGKIAGVIAGDSCSVGIESTVLDMTSNSPVILRPGIVTASEIEAVLGVKVSYYNPDNGNVVNSPGVKYKHYAPTCPVILSCDGNSDKVDSHYDKMIEQGLRPVILTNDSCSHGYRQVYSLGHSDIEVAHNLFSAIRQCDRQYDYIIIVYNSDTELSGSIYNRLSKTASGNML